MAIKQIFVTEDGKQFDNKQEAVDYVRIPKVREAFANLKITDPETVDWLIKNQEEIEGSFDSGSITRVTKKDRAKIRAEFDKILASDLELPFVREHQQQFVDGFKYAPMARLNDEEKAVLVRQELSTLEGITDEMIGWLIANKESVLEAYKAGVEKREIPQKAMEKLAEYRAKMAAEKAAKEAAKTKAA